MSKINIVAALIGFALCACSTTEKATPTPVVAPEAAHPSTLIRIKCINQNFTDKSILSQNENKFVIVPYKSLKTPGKANDEKDIDETDDLYFDRVSKMAEKVLTDSGLQKANASDKKALIIGLTWNTKKSKLGWQESDTLTSGGKGKMNLEKLQSGAIYLSQIHMKAVAPNKKTTRWDIVMESVNSDTFYLNVLPPMFVAGRDYFGKTCEAVVEKTVQNDSPDVAALRNSETH